MSYMPLTSQVTDERLKIIREKMKEVGRLSRNMLMLFEQKRIEEQLRFICMSCLDMLEAEDYDGLFDEIISLHTRKNSGYAGIGATDPWANFRTAEWFDVTAYVGCLIRMGDKVKRIENLYDNPSADQVNESIKDTLQDLAVYCIVAICLLKEEVSGVRKRAYS